VRPSVGPEGRPDGRGLDRAPARRPSPDLTTPRSPRCLPRKAARSVAGPISAAGGIPKDTAGNVHRAGTAVLPRRCLSGATPLASVRESVPEGTFPFPPASAKTVEPTMKRVALSVSSCSGFLVAGFHPRCRSAFAVSHDLDGLTFHVPSGVFQPVTLMGLGIPSERPAGTSSDPAAEASRPDEPLRRVRRHSAREPPKQLRVRTVPASRGVSTSSSSRSLPRARP
jgi:hypothetical protein